MTIHTLPWTFDEVPFDGELISLECRISFDCDPGDRTTPPHCALDEVTVLTVGWPDEAVLSGKVGMTDSTDLDDLATNLARQRSDEIIAAFSERLADAEEAALEDYYDRKRDELRGC